MKRAHHFRKAFLATAFMMGAAVASAEAQGLPATPTPAAASTEMPSTGQAEARLQRADHRIGADTSHRPVQVAAAASGAMSHLAMEFTPNPREGAAEPPAALLYLAGLLVVLFVSTRRRKDDR